MPPLDSQVLALLSSVATIFVQLIKGLLDESIKKWIPLTLFVILTGLGIALAFYYGRDPVAGALEGFFAAGTAIGFYKAANSLPGVKAVVNSEGWIQKK